MVTIIFFLDFIITTILSKFLLSTSLIYDYTKGVDKVKHNIL